MLSFNSYSSSDFSSQEPSPKLVFSSAQSSPSKIFCRADTPELVNLLVVADSQLKVIKTTVTSMLLHSCWPTKIWGSVLPVDHGSGKEQYPKIKNRREETDNETEVKTVATPWQQLHRCWQSHSLSSTQPSRPLVPCLGALVCEAVGHLGSQTQTLWWAFPTCLARPSPPFPQGLALHPYFLLLHSFTPESSSPLILQEDDKAFLLSQLQAVISLASLYQSIPTPFFPV